MLFVGACALSVVLALIPLAFVMFFVLSQGMPVAESRLLPSRPGPGRRAGGGMRTRSSGTLMLTGLAALIAVPIGVISGIYLSEYAARDSRQRCGSRPTR
jgi:phosphate transport system permease protein